MTKKLPWEKPTRAELTDILLEDVFDEFNIKVTVELVEPLLGTIPNNKKIFTEYVNSKMGDYQGHPIKSGEDLDEEIASLPENNGRASTSFHKDVFGIFIYNYMVLGNIKANVACLISNGVGKVYNYKKACDLFIDVEPRKIRFYRDDEESPLLDVDGTLERPIRASTPKGERICLSKSDMIDAKTKFKFGVKLLRNDRGLTPEIVVNAIKYGKYNGLGQWRGSGGYGKYKILSLKLV